MPLTPVRAGFMPLLDSATLVVAAEKGFARDQGLALDLVRETSWANIRDRVAIGHFDVAHMLAPVAIASNLGLLPLSPAMIAPMSLALGGNAVTVSRGLWRAMAAAGAPGDGDPAATVAALRRVIAARAATGQPPLVLAVVFPFSAHNYKLRYWLAAGGIHPDEDVRLTVVPPPFMVDALRQGIIDGFCVGDPWNSLAVHADVGVIATTASAIWPLGPDKVLGTRRDWAERHPETLAAVIRALDAAARWCGEPGNADELAERLGAPACLDIPAAVARRGLTGQVRGADPAGRDPRFLTFHRAQATCPRPDHALWFYGQMVRWGHAPWSPRAVEAARRTYRPDLHRAALGLAAAAGAEAGAGRVALFDGVPFEPTRLDRYIAASPIRGPAAGTGRLAGET